MNRWKEIAKFASGFEAFHALFHGYLWLTGTVFTAFGVTATPLWNAIGTLLNGGIAIALAVYGWPARKPGGRSAT